MRIKWLLLLLTVTMAMSAQKQFTLEDLNFGGYNYAKMSPENRYTTWWGDKLICLKTDDCAVVNSKTGKETRLFSLDDINKWSEQSNSINAVKSLRNVEFPYTDKPYVLVSNGIERMLIDFKSGKKVWRQPCAGETHQDWNAESRAVAFVKDNNLYITDAYGNTKQLTDDGREDIVYGQSVNRDEFGIYKGTFWSGNGEKLAFYRMDQSMVADYPLLNIDTRITTVIPTKYPMAGETSHEVTIGVYDLKTGKTIYLNVGNPANRYFTNIAWSPDNKTIYLIELNRDQTDMSLDSYDARTGNKITTLYREHNDKYVHPVNPITFLPWNNSEFILQSEKDGYNHLYLMNDKDEQIKQLTCGKWLVLDLMGFNVARKEVIILSTECNEIQNNIFAINIETGKRRLLDNGKGCHANTIGIDGGHKLALSVSGKYIVDNYTEPDVPRNIDIINVANGNSMSYFKAQNPWTGYAVPEYSLGKIKAADGKTDLFYRMVKPVNFNPDTKYPTIIYVYGGPGTRNVEARWHDMSRGWETYMAQKGYLLFILDNRGSSGRGRDFEQATFRHLGVEETKDQMKGIDYLKTLAYVDTTRIGVHGWSFGGFMTITMMATHPEVFKVGVAGGPVIDWKWYEIMYGERYMDTPQANPEGYAESSLMSKAANIKGKLQIIIGTDDPTVVPQHSFSFLKACILAGTQPDFFAYPGEPHNMRGHQSTHLHERITQYFDDYLK